VFDLLRWGGPEHQHRPGGASDASLPPKTRDYVSSIRQFCIAEDIEFIFPVTDFDVWAFTNDRSGYPRALVASPSAFALLADKYRLAIEAELSGLAAPWTVLLTGETKLVDGAEPDSKWRTKARFGTGSALQRVFCAHEFELVKQINSVVSIPTIVQPELQINRHVSLNCVAGSGTIVLIFQLEKVSHLNPSLSSAIRVVDALPGAVVSAAKHLIARHRLSGFFAMQFVCDITGEWCLIDLNLRLGNNTRIFGPYFPEIILLIFNSFGVGIPIKDAQPMRDLTKLSRDLRGFAAVALADEIVAALRTRRLPYVKPRYLAHPRDLFLHLLVSNPRAAGWHLRSMAKAAGSP
jgi:hypothetical protein